METRRQVIVVVGTGQLLMMLTATSGLTEA
jgi:hypothetical protein